MTLSPATVLMVTVGSAVSTKQVRRTAHAVAHAVGGRRVQGCNWPDRDRPDPQPEPSGSGAVCRSCRRVVFTVQGHGDPVPSAVGAGAADAQIPAFSTAFRTLSSLMALKATDGRPVSTVTLQHAGAGIARRVGD